MTSWTFSAARCEYCFIKIPVSLSLLFIIICSHPVFSPFSNFDTTVSNKSFSSDERGSGKETVSTLMIFKFESSKSVAFWLINGRDSVCGATWLGLWIVGGFCFDKAELVEVEVKVDVEVEDRTGARPAGGTSGLLGTFSESLPRFCLGVFSLYRDGSSESFLCSGWCPFKCLLTHPAVVYFFPQVSTGHL